MSLRTKRSYHMGFTEDMHYLTALLHERYPQKKLYLCGFSLGGNVILKMLGELGEEALERNIAGTVVVTILLYFFQCLDRFASQCFALCVR